MEEIEKRIADIYESAESWLPQVVEEDMAKSDYHEQGVTAYYKTKVRETIDLIYNNPVGNMWIRIYNRPDDNGEVIVKIVKGVLNHIDEEQVWDKLEEFAKLHLLLLTYEGYVGQGKMSKPEKPKITTLRDACDFKDKTGQSYNDIMEILASRGLINISTGYWKDKPKTDLIQILQSLGGLNYTYKLERREIHEIMRSSFNVKCNESLIRSNLTNPKTDYKIPVFKLKK